MRKINYGPSKTITKLEFIEILDEYTLEECKTIEEVVKTADLNRKMADYAFAIENEPVKLPLEKAYTNTMDFIQRTLN